MAAELTAHELIARHRPTLDQALEAIRTRAYWSPHPEHPKAYGEDGVKFSSSASTRARPPTRKSRGSRCEPSTRHGSTIGAASRTTLCTAPSM